MLSMPSLIFQLVAERTAADDPEPVATQFVLQHPASVGNILEQYDTFGPGLADPRQILAPIVGSFDHSFKGALAKRLIDRHFDIVTLANKTKVKRTKIAIVAYTQKAHVAASVFNKVSCTSHSPEFFYFGTDEAQCSRLN